MSERAEGKRELFHIGENYYAAIQVDEQLETFPLRLRALIEHLGKLFYRGKRIYHAMETEKIETERPTLLWSWCSRSWATRVLICAFLGAVPLLYSYRGQFGEWLIQLGERLEEETATRAVVLSSPAPVPLAQPGQQQVAPRADVPIPSSPRKNPSSPLLKEAAEPQANLASAEPIVEPAPLSVTTPLPTSSAVPVPSLMSYERFEVAQLEAANLGARETRNVAPPYVNSSAGKYFDVGKFRDGFRANQAVGELEQSGFHAIVVHNRFLWMNSYHVLAGPYTNQSEVEAARHSLESRGFDPRALQSKSTHFRLPPMTLYGTDLTIRDCVITWEPTSPDATVEFIQGRKVVATSKGRWEKSDFAFKADAVVSQESERGPETLLKIQRAGTDQELVLDGSVLKFYLHR